MFSSVKNVLYQIINLNQKNYMCTNINNTNNFVLEFYDALDQSKDFYNILFNLEFNKNDIDNLNLESFVSKEDFNSVLSLLLVPAYNDMFYFNNFYFHPFLFNDLKTLYGFNFNKHFFHIVTPSPWPLFGSISVFLLLVSAVGYMHRYLFGGFGFLLGFIMLLFTMFVWWRDVIREATWQGAHTTKVQRGLRFGFALFILSEVMFFFSIFWAFFHSSLSPAIELGSIWPPIGLPILDTWKIPFLNTLILLMSGITITLAHHSIIARTGIANYGFFFTIFLAILFTLLQVYEYFTASFELSDGIYGTTFFFSTGFHGFHVFIGTCFILVCWIRFLLSHFTSNHHIGFECAAWYWHFVDVVWLFLFVSIYLWGSL